MYSFKHNNKIDGHKSGSLIALILEGENLTLKSKDG